MYCNTCHAVCKVTFIVLFGLHFQNRTTEQQVYLVMFQLAYTSYKHKLNNEQLSTMVYFFFSENLTKTCLRAFPIDRQTEIVIRIVSDSLLNET